MTQAANPKLCSIVMPCYNRAGFLADAFRSISEQTYKNWELIIVDDGSSDDTAAVFEKLRPTVSHPVTFIKQANAGPAMARNAGIDRAAGEYVAFFDSDDLWLPHHLTNCIAALESAPEVDLVFGGGRRVDIRTGQVLSENSYYREGKPRPFLSLKTKKVGPLFVVDDERIVPFILSVDRCGGLQASVYRRRVFEKLRIPNFRVGEDGALAVRFLTSGFRMGYLLDVHTIYRIHGEQISSAAGDQPLEKRLAAQRELLRMFESLTDDVPLNREARRNVQRHIARSSFWNIGYLLWQNGRVAEARAMMRKGLRHEPTSLAMWKTFITTGLRAALGVAPKPSKA